MKEVQDAKTASIRAAAPSAMQQQLKETGTVKRVLLLLRSLVDYPGESAQSLAQRLNLPRSSVHRLLATLRENDFAQNEDNGTFGPGLELFRMAGKLGARMPYRKLAGPLLRKLSERFHETSILTLLERRQLKMFHAASGSPDDPMRYDIQLNRPESLLWGSTARVLLAHLSDAEIEQALARQERSPVQGLLPDPDELAAALRGIRERGYEITHSHRTPNTVGVAAPFFDGDGRVVGSLGFLIPEFRWAGVDPDEVVAALRQAAASLSRQLGCPEPDEPA